MWGCFVSPKIASSSYRRIDQRTLSRGGAGGARTGHGQGWGGTGATTRGCAELPGTGDSLHRAESAGGSAAIAELDSETRKVEGARLGQRTTADASGAATSLLPHQQRPAAARIGRRRCRHGGARLGGVLARVAGETRSRAAGRPWVAEGRGGKAKRR